MSTQKMSLVEQVDLAKLEKIIDKNKYAFEELVKALKQIKDRLLYRDKFKTFEEYYQTRWGWSADYGRKLLRAGDVLEGLTLQNKTMVSNERTARALSQVPAVQRNAVLENVAKSGKPVTGRTIADEAKKTKDQVQNGAGDAGNGQAIVELDAVGYPLPPELYPVWSGQSEVKMLLGSLTAIKSVVNRSLKENDPRFAELNNSLLADLTNAYNSLKRALPYAVCPKCQGRKTVTANCTTCKKRGWVSEFFWKQCVTSEDKKLREKMAARK